MHRARHAQRLGISRAKNFKRTTGLRAHVTEAQSLRGVSSEAESHAAGKRRSR